MNLLELQTRANLIVDKVNAYEAQLASISINEADMLAQHKYADLFCLRPVLKLLLGDTVDKKINRDLSNNTALSIYSSSAPMWNSKITLNQVQNIISYASDRHEFMNSIDNYNNNNLITLDQKQSLITDRETRISQGINYAHGASIKDALVTESQLANVFAWNTTDKRNLKNNIQTTHRQVPGIVLYYLGNGYDNSYTATIGCNESDELNSVQYAHPVSYGSWYVNPTITSFSKISTSQLPWLPEEGGSCCRIFIPGCSYTRGKLESPQQIWQPDRNSNDGIKYQGKAIYHELVFKNRRSGCTDYSLDFDPGDTSFPDNDPQGLATRLALAKQKEFYYNRPWFNELDKENRFDTSALADTIEQESLNKYRTYTLNSTNWTIPAERQNDYDSNTGTFYVAGYGEEQNDSIKCTSNITLTNNDSDSTSPHTNYATLCFWIDPTTVPISKFYRIDRTYDIFCQVNTSEQASLFIRKFSSGEVDFGFSNGDDGTITAADWNKTKYCLCTISTYGSNAFARLSCYDKDKQHITSLTQITEATYNYNSKALTCTFGAANDNGTYFRAILKIGITDLGIPLTDAGLGIPFTGKPGDLHEVILADSIDSYTSTIETTDHSDALTDEEFYKNYRLNWDTYAKTYNQPK